MKSLKTTNLINRITAFLTPKALRNVSIDNKILIPVKAEHPPFRV